MFEVRVHAKGNNPAARAINDSALSDGACRLMLRLLLVTETVANGVGHWAFPSYEWLAEDLGVSKATATRRVAELRKTGWLT